MHFLIFLAVEILFTFFFIRFFFPKKPTTKEEKLNFNYVWFTTVFAGCIMYIIQ